ncbi:MAG: hypothetical protein IIX69_08130 [Clostridia bacterium]|nr:hypothetical protein [Clostridia bacterium]MBQ5808347.1 hypothetical protein [Clostridia bacterium]
MSEAVNGKDNGEKRTETVKRLSAKANIISGICALVCIVGGAAVANAGIYGIAAVIALWAFASVACGIIFSFGSFAARIVPAVGIATSLLFGAEGVILAALAVVSGAMIALAVASRYRRFETVLAMMLGVCMVLCCFFGITVYRSAGELTADSVNAYIAGATENVESAYTTAIDTTYEALTLLGTLTPELEERLLLLASPDMAQAVAKSFIISLPAYVACAVTVLCYGISSVFLLMAEKTGNKVYAMRPFSVPLFMANVFIVCYFASIFISAETAVGLLVYYFSVIFTPCFAYVGVKSIIAMLRSGAPAFIRVAAVIVCIAMLPLFTYLITLLAFIGAYVVVRAASLRFIAKK